MVVQLGDWVLDVDVPLTMEISSKQVLEHCNCGYCRNYYEAVDFAYPKLRPFLACYGVNIEAPDELCPFEPTIYEATYILQGSIILKGSDSLRIGEIPLAIRAAEDADMETEHPAPYFVFCIGLMELPWLLTEPMEDVVSPANEPEYISRMQRKLLARIDSDNLKS